tara:strand:- start:1403 stop:2449 length:1047 start_codon:yes stop_codon:yes gene_type:complete
MINFYSPDIYIGIIIGGLVVSIMINQFKKKEKDSIDVNNFSSNIEEIEKTIKDIKKEASEERGSFKTILQEMKTEKGEFSKIALELKTTLISGGGQRQGAWGQMVLEHILDRLGFTEGQEYESQEAFSSDEGRLIPDIIIHFPDNRDIIVDAKVSLVAWDEYENSTDPKVKEDALARHRKSIKNHIDELSKKKYQDIPGIKSLDAVIMFCPNETAISSLGDISRKMMDYAISKKVTLVGPAMLYYTLKTVEYFWKSEKQSKNIMKVVDIANKISSQSVEIYETAKSAQNSITKTSEGMVDVMKKIKDGKGSLLSKVDNMNKIGGLYPKKQIPKDIEDDIDPNNPEDLT